MTNPNWNRQVKIGHGRGDTDAHHRAVVVAQQLSATGRWPNHLNTLIVIIHQHLPRPVTAHAFRQRGQFAHFGHVTHPIPTQFLKGVRAGKNQLVIIE